MKQATEKAVSDSCFSFNQKPAPFLCHFSNGCFYIKATEEHAATKSRHGALATSFFSWCARPPRPPALKAAQNREHIPPTPELNTLALLARWEPSQRMQHQERYSSEAFITSKWKLRGSGGSRYYYYYNLNNTYLNSFCI